MSVGTAGQFKQLSVWSGPATLASPTALVAPFPQPSAVLTDAAYQTFIARQVIVLIDMRSEPTRTITLVHHVGHRQPRRRLGSANRGGYGPER